MAKQQITQSFWADADTRRAEMRLETPFRAITSAEKPAQTEAAKLSQFYHEGTVNVGGADTAVASQPVSELLPKPEDLVYFNFRAISQTLVRCYSVDYTRPGVLEASVPMLLNQRVCKDHQNRKAEDACGVITQATWDATGKDSEGVPGINIRFFVDGKLEPRLVRLLSYRAAHSGSVTVGFEWEPSHPELLEQRRFWMLLGEEVEGSIVRLIVTKILFYDEFSLVYEGADSLAKKLPDDEAGKTEDGEATAEQQQPQGENTETRVKLKLELKQFLGLQHAAEDVPEHDVLAAIERLQVAQADTQVKLTAADAIISAERAEVLRQATLAEVGAADGTLPEVIANLIQGAPAAQLPALKQMYEQKAAARLGGGRSSAENNPVTGAAAKAKQAAASSDGAAYM